MARKFYTIFILPHAHARFRKLHVSRNFVVAIASLALTIGGTAALAPHLFFRSRALADHAAAVEAENRKLRDDKARYEASLAQMGEQLAAIESVAGRLAQAVGLKDLPSEHPAGGVGIPGTRSEIFPEESSALQKRMENLDASFDRLEVVWDERLKVLASTPSLAPVSGFFSDGYGWRRDPIDGSREFHKGVDIVAPSGTPVRAAADGLVTAAGRMSGYGSMIHLAHGYGMGTRYGHLSRVLVTPGQRVKRGDIIGLVGSTGRSTGPHLHYEVFRTGNQVDPRKYLGEALF
ncbi:MAG TPA: peptidoglycan DD-metalloendopeptidase family protein [Candidatus Polarisedimenticolaceae bacterium]|nr:peptidoglycan DD-metalloendopeptidase family protein [Candidatus Polarisedimenticolaceae bacterium]